MSSFTPSKRHSLHAYSSSGPKPLQLVTGPQASSPIIPVTPDHQIKPRTLRRQSSISYKRSSYDSLAQSRPPNEAGSPPLGGGKPRPRSVAYPAAPLLTPPLTLAEKYVGFLSPRRSYTSLTTGNVVDTQISSDLSLRRNPNASNFDPS